MSNPPENEPRTGSFRYCPMTASYAAAGVLVGAILVAAVTGASLVVGSQGGAPGGLASVYDANPVMWLITPAPLILGFLGAWVGRREDRIAELNHTLERKVYERTAELVRLNQHLETQINQQKKTESVLRSAQEEASRVNGELERANRRLNEAITQAQELLTQAESAGRAKSMFLANVTHEIRTPLNGIIGMAELAMMADDPSERSDCLETLVTCSQSLLSLIEDILDYSKLDVGRMELEHVNFMLEKVVDDAMKIARSLDREKGLEFHCHIDPESAGEYVGDPIRLRQVLVNLLGNAVKFTKSGEVGLTVSLTDDQPAATTARVSPPTRLLFSVEDTGVGVPPDKQHSIFETFTQADGSTTREFSGAGLGLAISRSLVELMDGDIWVESKPGRGSTFSFTVVLGSPSPAGAGLPASANALAWAAGQLRILVADDNVVSQIVVSRLLKSDNHSLMFADDGEEVISLMKARAFDLVFMGIHLPDMSGFETTSIVRRVEAERGHRTPIIGLVSEDEEEEKRWCLKSGMDAVVFKPVDKEHLRAAMDEVLSKKSPPGGGMGEASAVNSSGNPNW